MMSSYRSWRSQPPRISHTTIAGREDRDAPYPLAQALTHPLVHLCDSVCLLSFVLLLCSWQLQAQPYADFSERGAGFHGPSNDAVKDLPASVRLGVIAPQTDQGRQMLGAIELAVTEANAAGGYQGVPYEVIFRADDGPWGTASKKVVELIYDENVWAILGFLDGQHAHLAELIAAKAWVPVITPCAADRSIDYANVPWMFRCMPDDARQAETLLGYARQQGVKRLVVISEGEREARTGVARLQQAAKHLRYPIEQWLEFPSYQPGDVLSRLAGVPHDALLIWARAQTFQRLFPVLETSPDNLLLLPSEAALIPRQSLAGLADHIIVAAPYDLTSPSPQLLAFERAFTERTGLAPTPIGVLSYDAARMLLHAIKSVGLDRAKIRDALSQLEFAGLARTHRFNSLGGDPASPVLVRLVSGEWEQVSRFPSQDDHPPE